MLRKEEELGEQVTFIISITIITIISLSIIIINVTNRIIITKVILGVLLKIRQHRLCYLRPSAALQSAIMITIIIKIISSIIFKSIFIMNIIR